MLSRAFLLVKNNGQINGCKPWRFWEKLGFWTLNENKKTVINHTECIVIMYSKFKSTIRGILKYEPISFVNLIWPPLPSARKVTWLLLIVTAFGQPSFPMGRVHTQNDSEYKMWYYWIENYIEIQALTLYGDCWRRNFISWKRRDLKPMIIDVPPTIIRLDANSFLEKNMIDKLLQWNKI